MYTRVPVQRTTDDHCFGADYNPFVKMLDAPLTMMAEFNDVRPQGSEPIEWFVQVAIKVKDFPATTSRPAPNARPAPVVAPIPGAVSQHIPWNPVDFMKGKQTGSLGTYWLPPHLDNFLFYTGRMPFGGKLVPSMMGWHSHMTAFQEGFLFVGDPSQLFPTLDVTGRDANLPYITSESGIASNNTELRKYLFGQIRKSRLQRNSHGRGRGPSPPKTSIICRATGRREREDGTWYDRAAVVDCSAWQFAAGAQFTVVALCGPTAATADGEKRMQAMVAERDGAEDGGPADHTDFTFPMHAGFDVWYAATDGQTHVTVSFQSQTIDAHPPFTDRLELLRVGMLGQTPQAAPTVVEHGVLCLVEFFLWGLVHRVAITSGFLLGAVVAFAAWHRHDSYRNHTPLDEGAAGGPTNKQRCTWRNACLCTYTVMWCTYALALFVALWALPPIIITNPVDYDELLELWEQHNPLQEWSHRALLMSPLATVLPLAVIRLKCNGGGPLGSNAAQPVNGKSM